MESIRFDCMDGMDGMDGMDDMDGMVWMVWMVWMDDGWMYGWYVTVYTLSINTDTTDLHLIFCLKCSLSFCNSNPIGAREIV